MRYLAAALLAMLSSSLFASASVLQALDARNAPLASAMHSDLLRLLVRRKLWLLGSAAGVVGWGLEAGALSLASVAFVQPALGLGLIVLLALGARVLHERVGPTELLGAVAIAGAVAALAWSAPSGSTTFTRGGTWAVGIALVLIAAAPHVLRVTGRSGGLSASVVGGLGWAGLGLATALVVDAVSDRNWIAAVLWLVGVASTTWSALLAEMTALQVWPATRSVPVVFSLEMAVPAAVAPAIAHAAPTHAVVFGFALALACAGATLLGRSRRVSAEVLTG